MVVYRARDGKQRKKFAGTLKEARDLKSTLGADIVRGEYREPGKVTFSDYAKVWLDTYAGRTSTGIRPSTLSGYRWSLETKAMKFFPTRCSTVSEIRPPLVKQHVAWLFEGTETTSGGEHGPQAHTNATMLLRAGKSLKQVSGWLGHSDPAFTLRTYIHLLDDGLGDADFFDDAKWETPGATEATSPEANPEIAVRLETSA